MAFNLELVANYPAAFAGMFWFVRRLELSHAAALFGAMLFAFGGFNLLHHHHINMVAVVAHMPWLVAAADVLIVDERKSARTLAFAAMAALLWSEHLLGFPQGVWWNVMALAAFGAFRAGETGRWRQLLPCAAALALSVLLGAVQLLPSAAAAAQSIRMRLPRDFALSFSLHPFNLLQLWSPYFFQGGAYSRGELMLFHEFGIYSGAILPIALIWVWIRRDALPDRRRLIAAATVFAAVALVLALGRAGGAAALFTYVPVLQSLRVPARYILLAHFALTILAAITLDDLLAIAAGKCPPPAGRRLAALWIPAALGIVTTVALNARLLDYGRRPFSSAPDAAIGVAIVAIVTLLVALAGQRVRWAIAALVVATTVDLGLWGIRFIYRQPARTIDELTQAIPPAPENPADAYAAASMQGPYSTICSCAAAALTGAWVFSPRHGICSTAIWPVAVRHALIHARGREASGRTRGRYRAWLTQFAAGADGRPGWWPIAPGIWSWRGRAPRRRVLTERFHDGWSAPIAGARR